MKKSFVLLFSVLLLTSFVFGTLGEPQTSDLGDDVGIGSKEVVADVLTSLKDNLTKENLLDNKTVIGTGLPNYLQFINGITTIEGLIIYVSFFVMILILIYGIIELFSDNKTVRGIISGSVTLLIALTGSIQKIIDLYLGVDLINLNYKAISWKVIVIVIVVLIILAITKFAVHKMEVDTEKDSFWAKGLRLRAMLKRDKMKKRISS